MQTLVRTFGLSIVVTIAALIAGFFYGGIQALILVAILGVLELSLSFDNAIVNSRLLERLNPFWQKIFLTVGVLIAVVGMRFLFPLVIVAVTTGLNIFNVVHLAFEKGDPNTAGTYGYYLIAAHPLIAGFGGLFLLMLFLDFIFEDRDIKWLTWIEAPLARAGQLRFASYILSLIALIGFSFLAHGNEQWKVLIAGALGIIVYAVVNALGSYFENREEDDASDDGEELPGIHGDAEEIAAVLNRKPRQSETAKLVGKAAFFMFLYIEVIDASFSFDGAVGAFAITPDPIIIALGLGFIGAMFIRSLTVYLVKQGTLNEYVYLDHGAHWAIGVLALILLTTIGVEVPEIVTGLIGAVFIGAAFVSSLVRNKREAAANVE